MGDRTRLRLVFVPSSDTTHSSPESSPKERHLAADWREELSGSLEPLTPGSTPRETTPPWSTECGYPLSRCPSYAVYKLLVLGDAGVGKSALICRYVSGTFSGRTAQTTGASAVSRRMLWLQEEALTLQLTELSAEPSLQRLSDVFYKEAHACLVVFDLGDRRSLRSAVQWKHSVDALCSLPDGGRVPCLLLANKCDVTRGRAVTQSEVEDVVKQESYLTWIEVSAKFNFMVTEAIEYLLRVVRDQMGPLTPSTSIVHLEEAAETPSRGSSCCFSGGRVASAAAAPARVAR